MKNKRDIFAELAEGFDALKSQREGKLMALRDAARQGFVSVIIQFDGLMFTFRDGQGGKELQQNGTGIATGAVLAMND